MPLPVLRQRFYIQWRRCFVIIHFTAAAITVYTCRPTTDLCSAQIVLEVLRMLTLKQEPIEQRTYSPTTVLGGSQLAMLTSSMTVRAAATTTRCS